jgi:Pentapeptide repeats (8 copies)
LFGPAGVILASEAAAALGATAGILILSRDRWLTFGMTAALVALVLVLAGSIVLDESHRTRSPSAAAGVGTFNIPVNWEWQKISQPMARGANFRGADLNGANLSGLQLSYKDFHGAQANGASFRGSQLEYANLRGASLRGACLEGANLIGADLAGADFTGADVAGVAISSQAKKAALVWPGQHSTPAAACY